MAKVCSFKKSYQFGSYGFKRSTEQTQYLLVANLADNKKTVDTALVHSVFEPFSNSLNVFPTKNPSCFNVAFDSISSAVTAFDSLNNVPCALLNGRKLKLTFTEPKKVPKIPFLNQIECVCETSHVCDPLGLRYIKDFISAEEEQQLIAAVDSEDWESDFGRRVQHFGYRFDHVTREVDLSMKRVKIKPIPSVFLSLFNRSEFSSRVQGVDQVTVNEYLCGNGIRYHIDSHTCFSGSILVLSLLSPIVMNFRNPETNTNKLITLFPRSLLVLDGDARYRWEHGIALRKNDRDCSFKNNRGIISRQRRVSITFRTVRTSPCDCDFPQHCDDRLNYKKSDPLLLSRNPLNIEKKLVREVYSAIATHFSYTRGTKWPQVRSFLSTVPTGSLVVDMGCGNGKYFDCVATKSQLIGFDNCKELAVIAKNRLEEREVLMADIVSIPMRTGLADVGFSVAVLHHISSLERRRKCAEEMLRVMKPGGKLLVCAWAKEQKKESRFQFDKQDCIVPWNMQIKHLTAETLDTLKAEGYQVNDENQTVLVPRFCHVFCKGELESLFQSVTLIDSFYDQGNWCVIVTKDSD